MSGLDVIKDRQRHMWTIGDYAAIAEMIEGASEAVLRANLIVNNPGAGVHVRGVEARPRLVQNVISRNGAAREALWHPPQRCVCNQFATRGTRLTTDRSLNHIH